MITETKIGKTPANGDSRIEVDEDGQGWRRRNDIYEVKNCCRETSRGRAWEILRCVLRILKHADT